MARRRHVARRLACCALLISLSHCTGGLDGDPRVSAPPPTVRPGSDVPPLDRPLGGQGQPAQPAPAPAPTPSPDPLREESWRFLSLNEKLDLMVEDLLDIENPAERRRVRYLDLSHLYNALFSREQLEAFRQAAGLLMNALSRGQRVSPLVLTGERAALIRLNLFDLGWTEGTWETITERYPYAVRYDANSRQFPIHEFRAQQVRDETGARIPCIQADWFISRAARPPLYYRVLDIPETLDELAAQLGVNIADNLRNSFAQRVGITRSLVSPNNRLLERHPLPGRAGTMWITHDVPDNLGPHSLLAHPLDFQAEGHHVMFHLPNGLFGFMLTDGAGRRVERLGTDLVIDPDARDAITEVGVSCMGPCHQMQGVIGGEDVVRDYALNGPVSAQEREQILALYPAPGELDALRERERQLYQRARRELGVTFRDPNLLRYAVDAYEGDFGLIRVAAILGIREEQLAQALNADPRAFPEPIRALRAPGGTVPQDVFNASFAELLKGIGLGTPMAAGDQPSGGDAGAPLDAGQPPPQDAGASPVQDAGAPPPDAGTPVAVDAGSAPEDAGPSAADAGAPAPSPDAGAPTPPGDPNGCAATFGGAPGFALCAERQASCSFLVHTDGATCDSLCASFGAQCLGALNDTDDTCAGAVASTCADATFDQICECSRPAPATQASVRSPGWVW